MRYLNEVSQGYRTLEESLRVFDLQNTEGKLRVLRLLAFMCQEAGADVYDARSVISQSGLPADFHPIWRPGRRCQGARTSFATTRRGERILADRNPQELLRQYGYLMRLFAIADESRRFFCGGNCHHWWHKLPLRKGIPVRHPPERV